MTYKYIRTTQLIKGENQELYQNYFDLFKIRDNLLLISFIILLMKFKRETIMKKIQFFLFLLMLIPVINVNGQFLHVGIKTFISPYQSMSFYQYDINDYVYYFANEYNETIRFSGFETSESQSYIPFPSLYVKYDKGNNLFFELGVFARWSNSEAKYQNSVDFSEYANVFNPDSELKNLGYNSINLKWSFLGNSLTAGYAFLKTKTIRPYVYGGISALYLMNLQPGDYYEDTREVRNEIIFKNLSTFRTVTLYYKAGIGLKYHGLSLDVYLENNLGSLDKNADNDDDDEADEYYNGRPNYDSFTSINVSLSLNLLSFNFSKNQTVK
ncbi:MAG: hypothetical protein DRJ10_20965 [Bacteroidetes bacterium]|nr:MAG: hypothetical protein DRJ10_20965 [Bacteroidota bacterium]